MQDPAIASSSGTGTGDAVAGGLGESITLAGAAIHSSGRGEIGRRSRLKPGPADSPAQGKAMRVRVPPPAPFDTGGLLVTPAGRQHVVVVVMSLVAIAVLGAEAIVTLWVDYRAVRLAWAVTSTVVGAVVGYVVGRRRVDC